MANSCTSSGLKTSSTVVTASPASLVSLQVTGASGTWVVYDDNAAATSGTVLAKIVTAAGEVNGQVVFDTPIAAQKGIYVTQSGGTDFIVSFMPN